MQCVSDGLGSDDHHHHHEHHHNDAAADDDHDVAAANHTHHDGPADDYDAGADHDDGPADDDHDDQYSGGTDDDHCDHAFQHVVDHVAGVLPGARVDHIELQRDGDPEGRVHLVQQRAERSRAEPGRLHRPV